MLINLSLVSTPTSDTRGTSMVLHIVDRRYVIGNFHEGLQRATIERGEKLSGLSHTFLTGITDWRTVGGLTGWLLSAAGAFKAAADLIKEQARAAKAQLDTVTDPRRRANLQTIASRLPPKVQLTLHGGPNLTYLLACGRRFIFRKGFPIEVREYDTNNQHDNDTIPATWQNDQIRVWAMPVSASPVSRTDGMLQENEAMNLLGSKESQPTNVAGPSNLTENGVGEKGAMLNSVLREMFDSDWRMDDLTQMSLRDVKLPATVFVRNPQEKRLERYAPGVPIPENPLERPDIQVLVRRPWPGALVTQLPPTNPRHVSISYLFRLPNIRGKFLPKKAMELKVRPGADFSKLTKGESVQATDGTIVTPEQVLETGRPGRAFIVADIPTSEYIEGFLSLQELANASVMEGVVTIIWILGSQVADDARLHNFIDKRREWRHVISSPDYSANYLTYGAASESLVRHHMIDPERFDLPKYDNLVRPLPPALSHCTVAAAGLKIRLEPDFKIDTDFVVETASTIGAVNDFPEPVRKLAESAERESEDTLRSNAGDVALPGAENEIITLGTGSSLPSKLRNVSGTLLRVPGIGSYLLDCGENTLGSLARIYGEEALNSILLDLKIIWISHMHADHHLGLVSVIKAWYNAVHGMDKRIATPSSMDSRVRVADVVSQLQQPRKLCVIAESAMMQWLREYAAMEDYGYNDLVPLEALGRPKDGAHNTQFKWNGTTLSFTDERPEVVSALQTATGLSDLAVCSVPHCHGARGVALTFPDGFKLTYSGDSRPSRNLVEIGKDSTVLLHEATFDDEMQGDAKAKSHSTTSEALGVGLAMRAKRVILTHFSQRYAKIPVMSDLDGKRIVLEATDAENQDPGAELGDGDLAPTLAEQNPVLSKIATELDNELPTNAKLYADASAMPSELLTTITPSRKDLESMKVGIAFDSMRVKVKHIECLEKFAPAFIELYKNANDRLHEPEEVKAARQERVHERKALKTAGKRKLQDSQASSGRSSIDMDRPSI